MMKLKIALFCTVFLFTTSFFVIAQDDKQAKPPRAARSVHLSYKAPDATLFYNEVNVEQSQVNTYFCVNGFNHGYFGLQERRDDRVIIFSVWDPGNQNDPSIVEEDKRVKLLHKDDAVRTGRFGNEGTGGQSFFEYNWKPGETYRFLLKATPNRKRTEYAAYFYINEKKEWKHLATFSTLTGGEYLKGYYSFVEDFRRDGKSATEIRRAKYTNGWVKTVDNNWVSLTTAKFTADSTPTLNIDAGPTDDGFFLQTGGETKNNTPLWSMMHRNPEGLILPD